MAADGLKSAYDLAMERLANRGEGLNKVSEEQKRALAELSARTKAKIAEVEILYGKNLAEARTTGDAAKITEIEVALRHELARIREREETERRAIRN